MPAPFPLGFGRYELIERLAIGGMAELYRARMGGAHDFQKPVVIKKILPHLAADQNFVSMFIDEAKISAVLQHPKIVQVFELGQTEGDLFIAMEFVDGTDVLKVLRYHARRRKAVDAPLAVHIAHEILDALEHAHGATDESGEPLGIVHRDVSPGNVLLSVQGAVKLTDFGIARAAARNQKTEAGTLKGKYGYMAPEQVINGPVDGRSDLFATGVVLAEMLMGKRLFMAPSDLDVLIMVRDVNLTRLDKHGADIEPELRDILMRALTRDPKDRYQSAADFRDALGDWLFERRFRVTPAKIAGLVLNVREDAQAARRPKRLSVGTAVESVESVESAPKKDPELSKSSNFPTQTSANFTEPGSFDRSDVSGVSAPAAGSNVVAAAGSHSVTRISSDKAQSNRVRVRSVGGVEPVKISWHRTNVGQSPTVSPDFSQPVPATHPAQITDKPPQPDQDDTGNWRKQLIADQKRASGFQAANDDATGEVVEEFSRGASSVVEAAQHAASALDVIASLDDSISGDECVFPALDSNPNPRTIGGTSTIRLLYRLMGNQQTGCLTVGLKPTVKEVYFIDGVPRFVSSNVASERLGEFLVTKGSISPGELSMALSMLPKFGGRLGETLSGLGLMTPSDALSHLADQVRAKLVDLCLWQKGEYRWEEGKEIEAEWVPLSLSLFEIFGAATLQLSDEFVEGWAMWREDELPMPAEKLNISLNAVKLGRMPADVISLLNGQRCIADLRPLFRDQKRFLRGLKILYLLVQLGIVNLKSP